MASCASGLAEWARHPVVVLGAHVSVVYPLVTMYISGLLVGESTPRLRRGQWRRVICTIPALFCVPFYAHVQRAAHNYKEVSAASAAAIWCIIYVLRHAYELGRFYWNRFKVEWSSANAPETL